MYLISIYFDEKTNDKIERLIRKTAEKSGNRFMLDRNVPPHITISAFETKQEAEVIRKLEEYVGTLTQGMLQWVSIGAFLPHVIYLLPVVNEYLQHMSEDIYSFLDSMDHTIISKCYRPYQWMPHTTIGKTLTKHQMQVTFSVLQEQFSVFTGNVTQIGLAKTNPYTELALLPILEDEKNMVRNTI